MAFFTHLSGMGSGMQTHNSVLLPKWQIQSTLFPTSFSRRMRNAQKNNCWIVHWGIGDDRQLYLQSVYPPVATTLISVGEQLCEDGQQGYSLPNSLSRFSPLSSEQSQWFHLALFWRCSSHPKDLQMRVLAYTDHHVLGQNILSQKMVLWGNQRGKRKKAVIKSVCLWGSVGQKGVYVTICENQSRPETTLDLHMVDQKVYYFSHTHSKLGIEKIWVSMHVNVTTHQ